MKILNRPRQSGKSTECIIASHYTNYPILTFNQQACDMLIRNSKKLGYTIPLPISACNLKNGLIGVQLSGIIVDEFDMVFQTILQSLFGITHIEFCTMTNGMIYE